MEDVKIRPIRLEDAEDLLVLVNMPGVRAGTASTGTITMMAERKWLEAFGASTDRYCFGADTDGHIVGIVTLTGDRRPRVRHVAGLGMMVRDDSPGGESARNCSSPCSILPTTGSASTASNST